MKKWNTKYHGIGFKFEPQIVRIRNDEILRFYLTHQKAACQRLARVVRKAYRLKYGTELKISREVPGDGDLVPLPDQTDQPDAGGDSLEGFPEVRFPEFPG